MTASFHELGVGAPVVDALARRDIRAPFPIQVLVVPDALAGDRFFYTNPLESDGDDERQEYFDVACCPGNLARLMAQLPSFIYATEGDAVYVTLFVGRVPTAEVCIEIAVLKSVTVRVDAPINGREIVDGAV